MEEKNTRSNKLTHLFETLLQQEEQERQQEQEQEQEEEELKQEQEHEQRMMPDSSRRFAVSGRIPFRRRPIGTGKKKIGERENVRFAGNRVAQSVRSDDETRRTKTVGQSEWSAEAVSCLLDCYAEKFASGRGYLRNNDWEEVVSTVNAREGFRDSKTIKQCRDKVDSLKKRYRLEKKKAVDSGSSAVSWPLFGKLDEMMNCHSRVARIPGGVDAGVKLPFSETCHPDSFRRAPEQIDSPGEFGADLNAYELPSRQKRKMAVDETDGLSEDDFNSSPRHGQDRLPSMTATQESLDEGSRSRKGLEQPGGSVSKKRKAKVVDPIQALADAVVGFSDVFARIEMTKMEIFTKMKLEMAKLERKSRKRRSSSSSSSGTE